MATKQQHSIKQASELLHRLASPKLTPRVPKAVRVEAKAILEVFPSNYKELVTTDEVQTPRSNKTCIFKRVFGFLKT